MASRGLHEFTVQEARNFVAFGSWNYEFIDIIDDDTYHTAAYISSNVPAKKVILYDEPGGGALEAADILSIRINSETATKKIIKIDSGDFPFTITGLSITKLEIANASGDSSEGVAVLSFH